MAQQSLLGRVGQLVRANINALLDQAEDPQKMLDQMVRDYTQAIREAEQSVAQTIGDLRLMEDDHAEAVSTAKEWGGKAGAASRKADQLRGEGNGTEADRFDQLARVALQRQIDAEDHAKGFEPQIASRTEVVEKLKTGLEGMRRKLEELRSKRDELVARSRMAAAQSQVHDAVKAVDLLDPTSEVSRFEEKVRREEARVRGQEELAASSLDGQFEALEADGDQTEVELRLAALKGGTSTD
ncbi:PspA/IM30 family protein [Quadrisphaera setariae]|uniref:PspA/IM30 family protein n=1 Tax=Quadrisphaera setariae TaxID=2593304 RepID=A0A5C8ZLB1_9ACTN|nr:PspA/IM30 family protein [Quadrisphaera setariae]TXR57943.1 PspA/IM30 family protein [Quadrisphaera setariae]